VDLNFVPLLPRKTRHYHLVAKQGQSRGRPFSLRFAPRIRRPCGPEKNGVAQPSITRWARDRLNVSPGLSQFRRPPKSRRRTTTVKLWRRGGLCAWFECENVLQDPSAVYQAEHLPKPDTTGWIGSAGNGWTHGEPSHRLYALRAEVCHPQTSFMAGHWQQTRSHSGSGRSPSFMTATGAKRRGNRWGDLQARFDDSYPRDDATFWYTHEYYSSTHLLTGPHASAVSLAKRQPPPPTRQQRATAAATPNRDPGCGRLPFHPRLRPYRETARPQPQLQLLPTLPPPNRDAQQLPLPMDRLMAALKAAISPWVHVGVSRRLVLYQQ